MADRQGVSSAFETTIGSLKRRDNREFTSIHGTIISLTSRRKVCGPLGSSKPSRRFASYSSCSSNSSRAFTMIELLVIVLLVFAVFAMLLPVVMASKDTAKMAVCTTNMKQIYHAVLAEGYRRKGRVSLPIAKDWQSYAESIADPDVLICPTDGFDHFKLPTNNVNFIPPPPSVAFNELQSDDKIHVFRERENFELKEDLEAITQTGSYGRGIGSFDSVDIIEAGTMVDVFYFHFDPRTRNNHGSTVLQLGPNKHILGFIGRNDPGDLELNETDRRIGLEGKGVTYEKHYGRRLEGGGDPNSDRVTIPDMPNAIEYDSSRANPLFSDSMRVITVPGGGSSYGMNLEVHGEFTHEHQIFLTDAYYPIIDFDDVHVSHNSKPNVLAPRHFGKVNVLQVNGSVELVSPEEIQPDHLRWRSANK